MIKLQEVAESSFHEWSKIPDKIREKILDKNCRNCEMELKDGNIHYFLSDKGKIVWWHHNCPGPYIP